jgi:adenylate cyclase
MKKSALFFGFLFALLLHVSAYFTQSIDCFDLKTYDYIYSLSLNETDNSSAVIVDIDEKSLDYLGQWPWSRAILANLVSKIAIQKPTNIGLDILFPESDKSSPKAFKEFYESFFNSKIQIDGLPQNLYDNDLLFSQALKSTKTTLPIYMSSNFTNSKECFIPPANQKISYESNINLQSHNLLCSIEVLQKSANSIGFINAQQDKDGIFRRIPVLLTYKNRHFPAFGLANLLSVSNLHVKDNVINILGNSFKMDSNGEALLNFNSNYKTISAIDVLMDSPQNEQFKGKFVLIGTSAVGLHDRKMIPSSRIIPGVFVHATLIDNIINNSLIHQPYYFKTLNLIVSFFLSLLLVWLIYKKAYLGVLILFLGFNLAANLIAIYFMGDQTYISLGYFLVPFGIHFFLISFVFIFTYYKDRRRFHEELYKAHSSAIESMALVAETRDTETGAHIKRTREYMKILGEYLSKKSAYKEDLTPTFRKLIYQATPLHDIGKVGIPDEILKKPGKLSAQEYEIMKSHATIGKEIIENAMLENRGNEFLKIAYNIAYTHHEKWDGSGYPRNLKGHEIPLEGRMMAICDVYDALISKRYYKDSYDFGISEQIMIDGSGGHFDPILIEAFVALKDDFKNVALKIKDSDSSPYQAKV